MKDIQRGTPPLVLTVHQTRRARLFMNSLEIGGRQKNTSRSPESWKDWNLLRMAWCLTAILCLIIGEYFAWVKYMYENRFRSKFKEELGVSQAVMSAWVESQITTSTPVRQKRNHLCAQIKSTWPLGIFLTFFELYGISVFAPSQFFWQLSLSGVRELSRWPLWYTEGGGKFDMKVVPCPKKSYMEVKKSDMEVAPFSLIKALSTFLPRPYFHLFLTQLRYGVACFLTPLPLFFINSPPTSDMETLVFALNQ